MSNFKVRLEDSRKRTIVFEASPSVGENRAASYTGYGLLHMPAEIIAYQTTGSRHFNVTGPLVSRNVDEARANSGYVDLARSWVLPNFGEGSGAPGKEGSTPPILKLWAYNNANINGLQVVLRSYSFGFPNDVDYIHEGVYPFPTLATLTLDLAEVYSGEQLTNGAWAIKISQELNRAVDIAGDDDQTFAGNSLGLSLNAVKGIQVGPVLGQQTLLGNIVTGALRGGVSGIFQGQNVLKSILRGGVVGALQSPQLREVFNQVQTAGNQFITGVAGSITNTINGAVGSVSGSVQPSISDPSSGERFNAVGSSVNNQPTVNGSTTATPEEFAPSAGAPPETPPIQSAQLGAAASQAPAGQIPTFEQKMAFIADLKAQNLPHDQYIARLNAETTRINNLAKAQAGGDPYQRANNLPPPAPVTYP